MAFLLQVSSAKYFYVGPAEPMLRRADFDSRQLLSISTIGRKLYTFEVAIYANDPFFLEFFFRLLFNKMKMCKIESMVALGEIDFPAAECEVLSASMVSQA